MTAWLELGKAYTIFTKKTQTMTSSVMFVYKTDSVRVSSVNDDEDTEKIQAENEAEESSGLKGLFQKIFKKNEG